jgi:peptidoglycan-N-acetylglucosamine deacetylase
MSASPGARRARLSKAALYLAALGAGAAIAQVTAETRPVAAEHARVRTPATRAQRPARRAQPVTAATAALGAAAVTLELAGDPEAVPERQVAPEREAALERETALEHQTAPEHQTALEHQAATEREAAPDRTPSPSPGERATGAAYRDGMIITGTTPHRLILFTFDDGPDPGTTPLLLDRLDDVGIKAVFFLVASRIAGATPRERHQATIAREIARRGHLIGGHTVDHVQMPLLDDAAAVSELAREAEIFERVFGSRPWLFRPPFGAHSQRIDQHLAARRYTTVLWNLGAGDFQVRTAEEVFRTWLKVLERREREYGDRGGIVLLHDTYPWSVDAFQMIVSHLMARNCELLDTDEELYDIVDDLDFFYVPRGDAPAEAEAPPVRVADALIAERQTRLRESTERRCKSLAAAY